MDLIIISQIKLVGTQKIQLNETVGLCDQNTFKMIG